MSDLHPDIDTAAQEVTEEVVNRLVAVAVNPEEGEPFEFGGKRFTRRFLNGRDEADLLSLVTRVMERAPSSSIAESFLLALDHLFAAVAIILQDQDPECDEDWVRRVRGPGITGQMAIIVVAQIRMQEMTPVLGKLLALVGLAQAVTNQSAPRQST